MHPPDVPDANGCTQAAHSHHEGTIRLGKNSLVSVQDLEMALDAAVHVNRLLNRELESVIEQLRHAEADKHAWEAQAKRLATQLAKYKLAAEPGEANAAGSASHQSQLERKQQQLAARLADLRSNNDACMESQAHENGQLQQQVPPQLADPAALEAWGVLHDELGQLRQRGTAGGWLITTAEVKVEEVLGKGAFGTTYRAHWRGAQVAVKCVTVGSHTELLNFLRELECLAHLRHPNVVPFCAAVLEESDHKCWLVSDLMSGGTLAQWLHGDKGPLGPNKTLLQRVTKALEVCRGLAALEACSPPVLHRDVKPSNVFIDGAGVARLGDFGLSRALPDNSACLTGETGTYLYMSPEMVRHEVYDGKTDVWSFGVLLSELLTGQIPYQHTFMTPVQIAMAVADEKLQPVVPGHLPADLVALTTWCCDYDPALRPSFGDLVVELEHVVTGLQADATASSNSLFGLWSSNSLIPSSWAGVFGQVTAASSASNS